MTGYTNIELTSRSTVRGMHEQMLYTYELFRHMTENQHVKERFTDHISTKITNKIKMLHSDALPFLTISDHDTPYIIVNLTTNKYQVRHKFIKNWRKFDLESYTNDFKTLRLTTVCTYDDTDY